MKIIETNLLGVIVFEPQRIGELSGFLSKILDRKLDLEHVLNEWK